MAVEGHAAPNDPNDPKNQEVHNEDLPTEGNQEEEKPQREEPPAEGNPEDLEIPEPKKKKEPGEFEPSGENFLDDVLDKLKSDGVDTKQFLAKFAQSHDPADLDQEALEKSLGKLGARAAVELFKHEAQNAKAEQQAAINAVHETVGGKEMWDNIRQWIASGESGLEDAAREEYRAMLYKGGVQAQLAAQGLLRMYEQSPGFKKPATREQGDAPAGPSGVEPVGRREYAEKYEKILREKGPDSPELERLDAARIAGMKRGIK